MGAIKDFTILQGKTFEHVLRWEALPFVYKAITAITQTLPCRITATAHGMLDGWRVAVVSVKGMTQINAENSPPKAKDFHRATVIDANTVELNDVNSADYKPYTSGGYLQFYTPVDLTGYTARMKIKDRVGGTVLASSEVADTPLDTITITLDDVEATITITISATDTAALTWTKGVYDLELVSSGGVVTQLLSGKIAVEKEVTV
jgi:hypothetical protein